MTFLRRGDRVLVDGERLGWVEYLPEQCPSAVLVRFDDLDAEYVLDHRVEPSTAPRPVMNRPSFLRPKVTAEGLKLATEASMAAKSGDNSMASRITREARMEVEPEPQDLPEPARPPKTRGPRTAAEVEHPRLSSRQWSQASVVDILQRFAAEHGRPPRQDDFRAPTKYQGSPNPITVRYHFGSWNAAVAAAGLPVTNRGVRRRRSAA